MTAKNLLLLGLTFLFCSSYGSYASAEKKSIARSPQQAVMKVGCKYYVNNEGEGISEIPFSYTVKSGYAGNKMFYDKGGLKLFATLTLKNEMYLVHISAEFGSKNISSVGTIAVARLSYFEKKDPEVQRLRINCGLQP